MPGMEVGLKGQEGMVVERSDLASVITTVRLIFEEYLNCHFISGR